MESQFSLEMLTRIERCGIIAVLVVDQPQQAVAAARALLAGGVEVMELTLRTPAAVEALAAVRREVPEMLAGVGTVLAPEQIDQIVAAGAAFAVAPGTNRRVIEHARRRGIPFAPGVMTPSDIETALELGCREMKFFPAESAGGIAHLKNMAAPYVHLGVRFVPLGGLTAANMGNYIREPITLAIGGSWLASREVIRAGDWAKITANATAARQALAAAGR